MKTEQYAYAAVMRGDCVRGAADETGSGMG